jgi:hypothetical protein
LKKAALHRNNAVGISERQRLQQHFVLSLAKTSSAPKMARFLLSRA